MVSTFCWADVYILDPFDKLNFITDYIMNIQVILEICLAHESTEILVTASPLNREHMKTPK